MSTMLWQERMRPGVELREVVEQAIAALVRMDAERLEELATCCADLNRELIERGELSEAAEHIIRSRDQSDLLGLVLEETRANLAVFSRLHTLRLRAQAQSSSIDGEPFRARSAQQRSTPYGDD
jgi:hypothetical protein